MNVRPLLVLLALAGCDDETTAPQDLSAVEARLDALEAAAEADATTIAALQADLGASQDVIDALTDRVVTLETTIDTITGSDPLAAVQLTLDDHEDRLLTLEGAGYATEDWVIAQAYGSGVDLGDLFTHVFATDATLYDLGADVTALKADVAGLESDVSAVSGYADDLDGLFTYLTVDAGDDTVTFEGANVFVTNGAGHSYTKNGLGNLFIGYGEAGDTSTGSHNLIVGPFHTYNGFGGIVAGFQNTISGDYASALGGYLNVASGERAVVLGGGSNTASGVASTVSGGVYNLASGSQSSISGGASNITSGMFSSVSGGLRNTASGPTSSVSGGTELTVTTDSEYAP